MYHDLVRPKIVSVSACLLLFALTANTVLAEQQYQTQPVVKDATEGVDNGVRYDYAEFRFVDFDVDGGFGGDGFLIGGSYRLDQDIFLVASYTALESDAIFGFDPDLDFSIMSIGGGFIIPHKTVDLAAQFAFLSADSDPGDSENGFHMEFGGRTYLEQKVELHASLNYVDITDSDTFLQIGFNYFFDKDLSAGVTLDFMGDVDQITFGGRYHFK